MHNPDQPVHIKYQRDLQKTLKAFLCYPEANKELTEVVRVCHALALSYIFCKIRQGRIDPKVIGLTASDIAYDCIARLFQRNEDGIYTQFTNYFHTKEIQKLSDAAVLTLLRRLVYSKVNDGIQELS